MARKSLLTESEIRRFMKLANMAPVGEKRLGTLHEQPEELEMPPPEGDLGAEEGLPPGLEGEEELGVEEEPEVEEESDPEKEAMLADVVQAVADVLGVEVDVEGAEEEELPGLGDRGMYQERIVNEVAQRVAGRLAGEAKRDQVADQLAERILKRLTK